MSAPESTRRRVPSMPRPSRRPAADDKRALVERLLRAWKATSHEKLTTFLVHATGGVDLFYVDDETLVLSAELYASKGRAGT
jgi:hypothetical protein